MIISESHDYILILLLGAALLLLAAITLRRIKIGRDLKDQLLFLQTLVDSIPSPIFFKDTAGIYRGCNTAFTKMLGLPREEIVGKTVYDLSPEEFARIYEEADNALFKDGGEQRYETKVRFADDSVHEMMFTKAIFHDTQGGQAGLLGIMIDITQRKNAERELKLAHGDLERKVEERTAELQVAEKDSRTKSEFLDTVINSIDHGIVVVDATDYTIRLANKAAGGDSCDFNTHCYQLLHREDSPCFHNDDNCPLYKVKRTGKPSMVEHTHFDRNGAPIYAEVHTYPVFDDNNTVTQLINIIIDITTRKKAEKALLEAKEMAESANRMMSEFLDTVSHELRTPMTSVHGFTKLTQKTFTDHFSPLAEGDEQLGKIAEKIQKNLRIVISENERLTHLINDQLDLSKIQSGQIEWKRMELAPLELLQRTESAVASLFVENDLNLEVEAEPNLPKLVGDPDRIMQVLINLVSNAVKFSERGTISCKAEQVPEGVRFSVEDNGIGIPEDQQKDVFNKFKQIQNEVKGKPAGTGLGLAISKGIVEHHRGTIWVESEPGRGSTFFFTIQVE